MLYMISSGQTNPPIMNKQGEPLSKWGMILFFSFIAITAGLALWIEIADIWPANVISDVQAKWFNGYYYPKLTFAVIWILILIICAIPLKIIMSIVEKIK